MARMMLADADRLEQDLTAVADAIREVTESEEQLAFPEDFAAAIRELSAGAQEAPLADLMVLNELTDYSSQVAGAVRAYAFYGMTKLASVSLPNVTYLNTAAFSDCTNLAEVSLPLANGSSGMVFRNCTSLRRVVLPAMKNVGSTLFGGCSNLEYVELGEGAVTAYLNAFNNCPALTAVVIRAGKVCNGVMAGFQNTPVSQGTGYIYVPAELVEAYKTANYWSAHASQFRAIEDYPEICGGAV